jgi:hypothetical protein
LLLRYGSLSRVEVFPVFVNNPAGPFPDAFRESGKDRVLFAGRKHGREPGRFPGAYADTFNVAGVIHLFTPYIFNAWIYISNC